jgi:hypothetical protein
MITSIGGHDVFCANADLDNPLRRRTETSISRTLVVDRLRLNNTESSLTQSVMINKLSPPRIGQGAGCLDLSSLVILCRAPTP